MGIPASEILQKTPPHSDEAEAALLGGVLVDCDVLDKAAETVRPEDFYHAANGTLFAAMNELSKRGEFDVISLADYLESQGQLDAIGGRTYLNTLMETVASPALVPRYAKIVADKALLRGMIDVTRDVMARAYEATDAEVEDLVHTAEREILDVTQRHMRTGFSAMSEVALDAYSTLEKQRRQHDEGGIIGVGTGFEKLDELTLGLQPANLIIVAARPAMGKTSFALNIAENVGVELRRPVAFFSLEMSRTELGMRMLCSRARLEQNGVRSGYVRDPWATLTKAASDLSDAPIYIDDSPVIDLGEIRSKCRRLQAEKGLDLVLIDYLQLIAPGGAKKYNSREREVAEISRGLKAMSKELAIPVVVLAQLNRQVEATTDKRPNLSHLRESGALEQDADLVMFLYRREYYFRDEEEAKGKAEVIVSKNRHGEIKSFALAFLGHITRFENLAKDDPYVAPVPKPPGTAPYGGGLDPDDDDLSFP